MRIIFPAIVLLAAGLSACVTAPPKSDEGPSLTRAAEQPIRDLNRRSRQSEVIGLIARDLLIAGSLSLLSAGAARAEGWILTVGAQVGVAPPYEGADRDVLVLSPTVAVRPASSPDRFTPPDSGTTVAFISNSYFEAGPILRFRFSRNDKGVLQGLQKIDVATEPGLYADIWPVKWLRLRLEARHGVSGHYGWVGDAGADLVYGDTHWDASIGPRIGWGDHRYMQTYFGVTPQEAARSPRLDVAYTPQAGQRYTGLEAAVGYHLSRRWRIIADFGYQRLTSNLADSPIVRLAGMPDEYTSSLGFTYSFGMVRSPLD